MIDIKYFDDNHSNIKFTFNNSNKFEKFIEFLNFLNIKYEINTMVFCSWGTFSVREIEVTTSCMKTESYTTQTVISEFKNLHKKGLRC